jgi:hypothetical protein
MRFHKIPVSCAALLVAVSLLRASGPAEDSSYIFVDLSETQARTLPAKILLKPQTTCPVTKKPIDKRRFVDYNGKRIYVSDPECIEKVRKNPGKYIDILAGMGQGVETVLFTGEGKKSAKKRRWPRDTSARRGGTD